MTPLCCCYCKEAIDMWFCFTGDSRSGGKVNGAQSGLSIEHKAADPSSLMMMLVVIFMYL